MLGITTTNEAEDWSDEDILIKSQSAPWLYEILVDRYQAAFTRKATAILRNSLDAEEVVLDTFTKIYINADKYNNQPEAKFSSWAYRILMNTAFTRYQKLVKNGERFVNIDPEFEQLFGGEANHVAFEETRDVVERVLVKLPEHLGAVLRLHYLERWSHQDIADETGENVGTIKARIHRAKAAFRKEAKGEEVNILAD